MKFIYAIRDRLAQDLVGMQMYTLFVFRTDQQAVRYFADSILDDKSVLAKHPADYELVHLGTIAEDGTITSERPRIVITGDALIAATTTHQPQLVQEA